MFISKKSMPRRSFLRGTGATIALPFLSAMVPSLTALASTAAQRPRRIGFVYAANGMVMDDKVDLWTPKTVGRDFVFNSIMEPVERHRRHMTVVSNLMGAGPPMHAARPPSWLTDVAPKRTQDADMQAATSLDQVIARYIGQDTMLPSIELALESISVAGTCQGGYTCAYINTISWASPTTPNPMQRNPRVMFERMFGGVGTVEQRRERLAMRRSILDSVLAEAHGLRARLGSADSQRVDAYLENVREIERRIQLTEARTEDLAASTPESPVGIPSHYGEHAELMYGLLHIAYQADISRVFTLMLERELSSRTYPEIGVHRQAHSLSHHGHDPGALQDRLAINRYHMELFASFVDKLAATPDGDGSLLDHTLLMYGSGMSDGNYHNNTRLPHLLVSGFIKGNRHIQVADDHSVPTGELHVDVARQMGVELDGWGRSTKGGVGLSELHLT